MPICHVKAHHTHMHAAHCMHACHPHAWCILASLTQACHMQVVAQTHAPCMNDAIMHTARTSSMHINTSWMHCKHAHVQFASGMKWGVVYLCEMCNCAFNWLVTAALMCACMKVFTCVLHEVNMQQQVACMCGYSVHACSVGTYLHYAWH
jgi:hypothetical protein